ncbi:M23 family metallopeptidase [Cellulomonas wangsupingiae]|uniref:Peptidoglycan DD-metalloendopeptidase family protein n=1 Tax=Cellulomonas wangsupingiae TaxID=2968085 RepID=A0ABY5KB66_9CELL|nr:M23 family metallopeptidase [Cellulomonas wangsupingiae]MCC2334717.1 peptidoglycan DD-metalloendopeptidase family protein [Cellulomonas wangsupingiae]UUI66325.1 peptidoglycan DD-metalloendopeptidase family protein [Cellulomonas wangsupingiae]
MRRADRTPPTPARRRPLQAVVALLAALAVALPALLVGPTAAHADELSNKRAAAQERAAAAEQRAADLAEAIEELSGELADALTRLAEVEAQLPVAQARLDEAVAAAQAAQREAEILAARLQAARDEEAAITEQIAVDDTREAEIRSAIGQMAREAYKGGRDVSGMSVMLDAESSQDFVEKYGLVSTALRTQTQVLDELTELAAKNKNAQARQTAVREKVDELKVAADQKLEEARQAQAAAEVAKAEVERLVAEQQQRKADIESRKSEAQAQVAANDAERAQVGQELAAIIEQQRVQRAQEEAARAAAGKNNGGGGGGGGGGGSAPPNGARPGALFANPTAHNPMVVTSEYGNRLHPVLGYWRLHAGIDLRDRCGEPVYAARAGTVQWAKFRSGYGGQVMIDHGWVNGSSLMSSYNHMSSFAVGSGAQVGAGQVIGYAGNTGTSAACHLHFEVYINGGTVNPRPHLGL